MFFSSVHLILVCKSKCPKIMDTYQGEWGHCDNRYCLRLLSFHCCYWDLSWPGLPNYFLRILGALISFSHSLNLNQQLIIFQRWSLVLGINLLSSQSCTNNECYVISNCMSQNNLYYGMCSHKLLFYRVRVKRSLVLHLL